MKRSRPPRGRPAAALTRARMADLRGLRRDRRTRQSAGRFLVEGFHVVETAIQCGAPVREVFLSEGAARSRSGERIAELAREQGVPLMEVTRRVLDDLADADTPQGVVAVVDLPDAEEPLPLDAPDPLVVLDGVQDPGNAGAILRAADAFRCGGIVFCRGSVEAVNPKVLRAAQGSHFHLPVRQGPAALDVVAAARAAGRLVVATVAAGGRSLYEGELPPERTVVVFGNEARGLSPAVVEACDRTVTIPMPGRAESLGVAAAAAVVLSWLRRGGTT